MPFVQFGVQSDSQPSSVRLLKVFGLASPADGYDGPGGAVLRPLSQQIREPGRRMRIECSP